MDNIIRNGYTVLLGDASGADKTVQEYLHHRGYGNVVVYCAGGKCRNNVGNWPVEGVEVPKTAQGRDFYTQKDIKMASESDYGFVLWNGKSAGALSNIIEMVKKTKYL